MKRKRVADFAEQPQETIKSKKQKSQGNNKDDTVDCYNQEQIETSLKRKGAKLKEKQPQTSIHHPENVPKKKRKAKGELNQNGEISKEVPLQENSSVEKKKKNGLPLNLPRANSDSPSDFQPLVHLKQRKDVPQNNNMTENDKGKKKRGKKVLASQTLTISEIKQEEVDINKEQFNTNYPPSLEVQHGVLKKIKKKDLPPNKDAITKPNIQKGPKKKVRIDETESLKIKKELADAEPHFSAKELPAKIIKSKSNKNLTEEVKVSPLTIQGTKKERKTSKKIKMESEDLDEDEEHAENGMDHDATGTSEESDLEVYYINKNAEREAKKNSKRSSILMPKEDQLILVQRMQEVIPHDDTKSYQYRLHNMDWQKVAFKNYPIEECQKVWSQLFKKVRHYRLLVEITNDVKTLIEVNDLQPIRKRKNASSYPEKPKRPLSAYLLFFIRKRDKIAKEHPDLDTTELNKQIGEKYHNLSAEKKEKYEMLAAKNKEEYKKQMEEFYVKHPELRKVVIKKEGVSRRKEPPPKRPENPFKLFMKSQLEIEPIAEEDKAEFKEICKEKWSQMSDTKKVAYINQAEEQYSKYEMDLKEYMARHPEYTPKSKSNRPVLNKKELILKDKLAGKPKKPPTTAYGLFSSMMMHSSEIVDVQPKERWNYISCKWKAMTDEEREQYKQLLGQVNEQYEKDFKAYLDTLPEEKRQAEILNNLPKRRKSVTASHKPSTSRSKAKTTPKVRAPRIKSATKEKKLENPVPPPRSAYKYFAEKYSQGDNAKEAWKNLPAADKEKYEEELSVLKENYIKAFEAYLKSLTKEELAAFCANRSSQGEYSSSDESEPESDVGDENSSDESSNSSESDNDSDEN